LRSDILVPTIPAALILLACAGLPNIAWVAMAYLTIGTAMIDAIGPEDRVGKTASPNVSLFLGCLHFPVLYFSVATVSSVSTSQGIVLFLATGFYLGQVSNSAAHELIHIGKSIHRNVGRWVYISLLFGHHSSAHTKVHHRFVATPDDPNSAHLGESLYAFLPRAWVGSFRLGLSAESEALRRQGRKIASRYNPYWLYVLGAIASLLVSFAFSGVTGIATHIALACWTTTQLLTADYVQHYGLRRLKTEDGYEPIGTRHSWNAPKTASVLLMLQAPLHSAHHLGQTPTETSRDQPILPYSLPAMVTLAFFPRTFQRVMDRRLANLGGPGDGFGRSATEMTA
jgi:alkane 1-monooxygenase